jgi:hypothetical protein
LTGADGFVLALEHLMRRHRQRGLIGQTHLRLDAVPDLDRLAASAARLAAEHPLLNASVRRSPLTFLAAWHRGPAAELPVRLWAESGAPAPGGRRVAEVDSEEVWVEEILNQPLEGAGGARNLRIDLLLLRGGGSVLVLTWTHLLFDGKGAEFLVDALVNPRPISAAATLPPPADAHPLRQLRQLVREATPVVLRFFDLARNPYASLGGPRPIEGRLRFRRLTFDRAATSRIQARIEAAVGPLFSMGFFLACALRAHREAFLARGADPLHYVVSIPVQIRKKGPGGSPFQNRVSILFFSMERRALESVASAAKSAQDQFEEMTRARLDRSFSAVLELMSLLPAPLYMAFLRRQFGGEITSFFHSFTGDFAVRIPDVFGAPVSNAYHIPSVSSPPGSGLFFGMFDGQLNVTFSWREGAVSEGEVDRIFVRLNGDLQGGEP